MIIDGYDPDELLTVAYLSEITHVTKETIRRYIRTHNIPAIKHRTGYRGRFCYRVRRADWRRFLWSKAFNNCTPFTREKRVSPERT